MTKTTALAAISTKLAGVRKWVERRTFAVDPKRARIITKSTRWLDKPIDTLTQDDVNALAEDLRTVKQVRREAETHYKETLKDPLNEIRNMVLGMEGKQVPPLKSLEQRLGDVYARWVRNEELKAAKRTNELKAQSIAQAQDTRATQVTALQQQAETEQNPSVRAALHTEATSLAAAPLVIERTPEVAVEKPKGLGVSRKPVPVVDDLRALMTAILAGQGELEFIEPNMTALRKWAESTGGSATLPGVRIEFQDVVSGRALR